MEGFSLEVRTSYLLRRNVRITPPTTTHPSSCTSTYFPFSSPKVAFNRGDGFPNVTTDDDNDDGQGDDDERDNDDDGDDGGEGDENGDVWSFSSCLYPLWNFLCRYGPSRCCCCFSFSLFLSLAMMMTIGCHSQ